ncbi:MAG TPA: hypothetical protein VGX25_04260 [Actinophytocola sp.]|uniref:hypothetical protein n=1 Tax=Actinophytocola sp. TaxID=1872138 RepID=UPI002DDD113F|nr:hypothetical protein [Actinophytocola sp.]HEV2778593.1 hypothetical protein [Actinophytocola sp.]
MRDGYIPPDLEALLRRADDAFTPFRTRLARARELPLPAVEPPDPERLRAAARQPDAPDELKAVDRAVCAGRATWRDVLSGRLDHLPEVAAFYRAAGERLVEARDEEVPVAAAPEEARRPAPPVDDWDDEPPQTFLRRGW